MARVLAVPRATLADAGFPNPPAGYLNVLWGVSAVSCTSIWAVGTTDYGSTLIVHWNGKTWS